MNHIDRFYATIERKPVDRPCTWLGQPTHDALRAMCEYFKVSNYQELITALDDDIVFVELPYHSPTSNAIYAAFDFAKKGNFDPAHRTLTASGFFENCVDPMSVDDFDWPDPSKYIDRNECIQCVRDISDGHAIMAILWSAHFQDACAAFGMENAFIQMATSPDMFRAVINRIVAFYLQANEIFYSATKGRIHAVLIGNDLGSQTSLMLSRSYIKEFVLPGTKKLIEQAKSYGLKVIHHSCGAIHDIIPDLIEIGVDAIHPIQALATGMAPNILKKDFGDNITFCGGVDTQKLLVNGTPNQVRENVLNLIKLFPTGLILSPSHEAILPDIPPENIHAMFDAVHNIEI